MAEPARTEYSLAMIIPRDPLPLRFVSRCSSSPAGPDRAATLAPAPPPLNSRTFRLSPLRSCSPPASHRCLAATRVHARGAACASARASDKTAMHRRRFEYGTDYYSESIALRPTATAWTGGKGSRADLTRLRSRIIRTANSVASRLLPGSRVIGSETSCAKSSSPLGNRDAAFFPRASRDSPTFVEDERAKTGD